MTTTKRTTKAASSGQQHDLQMPPSAAAISVLESKVDGLVRQGQETNETLRSVERAVNKLAVIEERQITDRQSMERAFVEIKSVQTSVDALERDTDNRISNTTSVIDGRLKTLEAKAPMNDLSNGLLIKAGWLVISAVIGAVLVVVLGKAPVQAPVFIQQAPATPAAKPAR